MVQITLELTLRGSPENFLVTIAILKLVVHLRLDLKHFQMVFVKTDHLMELQINTSRFE